MNVELLVDEKVEKHVDDDHQEPVRVKHGKCVTHVLSDEPDVNVSFDYLVFSKVLVMGLK